MVRFYPHNEEDRICLLDHRPVGGILECSNWEFKNRPELKEEDLNETEKEKIP